MDEIYRRQHQTIGLRTRSVRRIPEHGRQSPQRDRHRHVESVQHRERSIRAENTRDQCGQRQDSKSFERRKFKKRQNKPKKKYDILIFFHVKKKCKRLYKKYST